MSALVGGNPKSKICVLIKFKISSCLLVRFFIINTVIIYSILYYAIMLRIGITSRALFDLDSSHSIFENEGLDAYKNHQVLNENFNKKTRRNSKFN